jgi:hypothetical protein
MAAPPIAIKCIPGNSILLPKKTKIQIPEIPVKKVINTSSGSGSI